MTAETIRCRAARAGQPLSTRQKIRETRGRGLMPLEKINDAFELIHQHPQRDPLRGLSL